MKRTTIVYDGVPEEADELDFEVEREGWSAYKVEDGTIIKLKNVGVSVYRLINRTKPDGSPMYVLTGTAVLTTELHQPVGDPARSGSV